jgi:hypothetical protein
MYRISLTRVDRARTHRVPFTRIHSAECLIRSAAYLLFAHDPLFSAIRRARAICACLAW